MRVIETVVNGSRRHFSIEDCWLLLDVLRQNGYLGAKPSCEMEVCGSCTVLLDGLPVSACTTLAAEAEDRRLETVEGLAQGDRLHPLQEAFLEKFSLQCGYCTSGMLMAAKALLEENPAPTRDEIVHWMDGNICRCTGYESILDAIELASTRVR